MNNYYQTDAYSGVERQGMHKVLRQAYTLVALSLIPTIIGAFISVQTNLVLNLMISSPILFFVGFMVAFYGLSFAIEANKRSVMGLVLMFVFTFLMGMMLGPLLTMALRSAQGWQYIGIAAGGTAGLFLVLAILGGDKTKDFSPIGKYVGAVGIVMIATIALNFLFLKMPMINLVLSMLIIPFSGAIILWRINSVVRGGEDNYISVALDIYISLYNIFSSLLRLILASND
ncbi:Bax inhibitor-1 family protein [Ignatzschineria rhizosphaerae]|uniref:Bax inhibitor-1 family protein n=1 Tax=Ignatzschineria rhizosphaerae TaxID=2923279 RepID=A0ABY3XBP2_9GAMM|nr:Bax inhibitor-1 family protein [Ignatzschineria rhizosphaerae]UNM97368.1 Bax inhibitor-1 family protein [Ignatzschineria rhizosphaerae]